MAGSYSHCTNEQGQFVGLKLLDTMGDCHEALEEMYGMIWYLADGDAEKVEQARVNYKVGLHQLSPKRGVLPPDDE